MNVNKQNKGMTQPLAARWLITRRDCLKAAGAAGLSFVMPSPFARADRADTQKNLRFGIVTDIHYAKREPAGKRHFQASVEKMAECVKCMNEQKVDFLIELGDFKDQRKPASEASTLEDLETIEATFKQFKGSRYHVLGNHDMDSISKEQFQERVENTGIAKASTYYSFDHKRLHFVVLDANFNADGSAYAPGNFQWSDANIPRQQLEWLERDLAATTKPVIVFIHQLLDAKDAHAIKNAAAVRKMLQAKNNVLAVFQGHQHAGDYRLMEGIHYYTLKAMVDGSGEKNNAYAIVEVDEDNRIMVTGYRLATSQEMKTIVNAG